MLTKIINWILGNLPLVIFALVIISQVLRAAKRAREQQGEEPRHARPDALEADRREREVKEQIRRRIAERRGPAPAAEPPIERPAPSAETTQLPDVFDGPLGRMLQELQKRAQPKPEPEAPPLIAAASAPQAAEIERQEQLQQQMRDYAEAQAVAKRRATHLAEAQAAVAQAEPAMRAAARGRLLDDLRDPQSLRRAIVLREVLGTPVGLR